MTKILIITPSLTLPGGVSNFTKLLSKELNEEKFEIKYLFVGKTGIIFKDLFYPLLILINIIRLKKLLKNFQPDIVHINPSLTYIAIIRDFLFLKIIKKRDYPIVFFIHGWRKNISKKFENILFKNYFKKRFDMADVIVVLANQFKDKLSSLGVSPHKIHVSSTMVESAQYSHLNKKFSKPYNILFCATMKKSKGPYELLNAIPSVIKKYHDTSFIFVGDGKDLGKLKRKIRKMSIENNVIFTGYKTGNEKIEFFKKAHIFVFPSYSEGFPTVVLEAMAAGLPLIIRPVGGLADTIKDGRQGLIISTKIPDSKEIAEKVIYLIENPNLMEKMSKNNVVEAKEKYDFKIICGKLINIYETILKR